MLFFSQNALSSAKKGRKVCFHRTSFQLVPNWSKDQHSKALDAFLSACKCIMRRDGLKSISSLTEIGQEAHKWQHACLEASKITRRNRDRESRLFFEREFIPYRISNENGSFIGRATGYYEVELFGSARRTHIHKFPVYRAPGNLNKLSGTNKLSRAAIDNGSLSGGRLEIAWVSSKAKLFMAHLQGAASIKLRNNAVIRVSYDGQNGFPHRDITHLFQKYGGKNLNSVLEMMMWIDRNPKIADQILHANPSYIFFKISNGKSVVGGHGSELIPGRSVAINSNIYPYGMPIWVQSCTPKIGFSSPKSYEKLLIAQDSGGAIRDPLRIDIFFGSGRMAEEIATRMNEKASYIVLFPRNVKIPDCYIS
ncbi:Membrane-bound lytic murein transglycosylase A [Candidatus Cyrtobacter comes]|uniref:peptidoglycan lytic exotransglycosylase n=1 Tax=Candidatus Cyrtobacter comes TaxID=675776 RepID=A0ABU5L7L4_9RICK|nr:Membrane-bound lytic murein transglycosylase A [Candidatus Cyrtobacter comes]